MTSFHENKARFLQAIKGRGYELTDYDWPVFWLKDVTGKAVIISRSPPEPFRGCLKVENPQPNTVCFVAVDGTEGLFKTVNPPIADTTDFKYVENGQEKEAGPCDALLIDGKWRFIEFKTDATTQHDIQADHNRHKARLQMARTLTFFKEQLPDGLGGSVECIRVFPPTFPKTRASNINERIAFLRKYAANLIEIDTLKTLKLTT